MNNEVARLWISGLEAVNRRLGAAFAVRRSTRRCTTCCYDLTSHSFCIEWGGVRHCEDGAPHYLFVAEQGPARTRFRWGIAPREFVREFDEGVQRCFADFEAYTDTSLETERSSDRFGYVFIKAHPLV